MANLNVGQKLMNLLYVRQQGLIYDWNEKTITEQSEHFYGDIEPDSRARIISYLKHLKGKNCILAVN